MDSVPSGGSWNTQSLSTNSKIGGLKLDSPWELSPSALVSPTLHSGNSRSPTECMLHSGNSRSPTECMSLIFVILKGLLKIYGI